VTNFAGSQAQLRGALISSCWGPGGTSRSMCQQTLELPGVAREGTLP
jgi:hypothetical protein